MMSIHSAFFIIYRRRCHFHTTDFFYSFIYRYPIPIVFFCVPQYYTTQCSIDWLLPSVIFITLIITIPSFFLLTHTLRKTLQSTGYMLAHQQNYLLLGYYCHITHMTAHTIFHVFPTYLSLKSYSSPFLIAVAVQQKQYLMGFSLTLFESSIETCFCY